MLRKITVTIVLLSVILVLLVVFVPSIQCLTVKDDMGRILYVCRIDDGDRFIITYNHSANLSPVADTVEYSKGSLIVRSSLFQTFGAGIPIAEDGGSLKATDEGLLLDGIDRQYEKLDLMTGTYADHHLITPIGESVRLKDIAGEQKHIIIKAEKLSIVAFYANKLK